MTDSENRVKLYEAIASNNPKHWTQRNLVEYDHDENDNTCVFHCDIGWALVKAGMTDQELLQLEPEDVITAARLYGVDTDVIGNVVTLNDEAPDFETNLEAVKTYLVEGSITKALDIIDGDDNDTW